MCGINGLYGFGDRGIPEGKSLIQQMNRAIRHRGPDDNGNWADESKSIYLGHQRLSILDLSENGHQPMHSSERHSIVFNGEIYNFKAIRQTHKDRHFFSESDTEVILASYAQYGEHCLDKLNGMFAFAIWDSLQEKLFLARDRIGIKPLYYTTVNGIFAFSSEIKALLTLPWVHAELDEEDLYHFLTFNKVFPPKTMFKNIYKFHPGHKMVVTKDGIEAYESYWEPELSDYSDLSEHNLQQKVYTELEQSVQRRLLSDVPVGAFLSGGVDSSIIVSLMKQSTSATIKTYSIGFKNSPSYNELDYAQQIASRFNTEHIEKIVEPEDIEEFLPQIVEIFDEPLADATSIPIHFISQLARKNGTIVVLTGDGADELFCGYRNWMRYIRLAPFFYGFSSLPVPFKKLVSFAYNLTSNNTQNYEMLMRATKDQEFFWGGAGAIKESVKDSFLSSEFSKRLATADSHNKIFELREHFKKLYVPPGRQLDNVDWMTYTGLKHIIPNYYLYRADRLGMANSIELRVPFLDHNVVNLALSISGKWKTLKYVPKYILKKSFEQSLSKEILYRKKQGFCVPLQEWAGDTINRYIDSNLHSFCKETGLFNETVIRAQLLRNNAGHADRTFSLWNLYFLMAWFKKWLL